MGIFTGPGTVGGLAVKPYPSPPPVQVPLVQPPVTTPVTAAGPAVKNITQSGSSVTELNFTGSGYGGSIPKVFGSDKISGNVIWAAPFEKHTYLDAANNVNYTYATVSFAVAVSEGEITDILRIWAGDNLIYDRTINVTGSIAQPESDGVIASLHVDATASDSPLRALPDAARLATITVFKGTETQVPLGAIVDVEGYLLTPAYRGVAYVLFQNYVTANGSIPNLSFEVVANGSTILPRVYGILDPMGAFDNFPANPCEFMYDPSYDVVVSRIYDVAGDGGIGLWQGNTLERIRQYGVVPPAGHFNDMQPWLLPSGKLLTNNTVLDHTYVMDPHSGVLKFIDDTSTLFGFYPLGQGSCAFNYLHGSGNAVDMIFATYPGTTYKWALAEVDADNNLTVLSSATESLPAQAGSGQAAVYNLRPAEVRENPTFYDEYPTNGVTVWVFNAPQSSVDGIHVVRFVLNENGMDISSAPTHEDKGLIIDADQYLGGKGLAITVVKAFVDPTDHCFLLIAKQTGRSTRMLKWNPFTNVVVWSTPCNFISNTFFGGDIASLRGNKYAFIDAAGDIRSINLSNGDLTLVSSDITSQDLLTPTTPQYYNAAEDTILYGHTLNLPMGENRSITKVFLSRGQTSTVLVSDIVTNLLERVGMRPTDYQITDLSPLAVNGYTLSSPSTLRDVFSQLAQVFNFDIVESTGMLVYKTRGSASSATVSAKHLKDSGTGWLEESQDVTLSRTRRIALTYRDSARDYAENTQKIVLPNYLRDRFEDEGSIDVRVPVVLTSDNAYKLAETLIYAKSVYAQTYAGMLPARYLGLDPGDVVTLALDDGDVVVRLRSTDIGADKSIAFKATREDPSIYADTIELFGNLGRFDVSHIAHPQPRYDAVLMQMPARIEAEESFTTTAYRFFLVLLPLYATGTPPTQLQVTVDNTTTYSTEGPSRVPTWGYLTQVPSTNPSYWATDRTSSLRVRIMNTSVALASVADKTTLVSTPQINLAWIGPLNPADGQGELIQFQTVTSLGSDVYEFTNLHRGLFGTEVATSHVTGERFVLLGGADGLIDQRSVITADLPLGTSPLKSFKVSLVTNNPYQPDSYASIRAENLRERVVGAFNMDYSGTDVVMDWQHGYRYDSEWVDSIETIALNGSTKNYRLYLYTNPLTFDATDPATYLRKVEQTTEGFTYTAAMQTTDSFTRTADRLYVAINQIGSVTGQDNGPTLTYRLDHI